MSELLRYHLEDAPAGALLRLEGRLVRGGFSNFDTLGSSLPARR